MVQVICGNRSGIHIYIKMNFIHKVGKPAFFISQYDIAFQVGFLCKKIKLFQQDAFFRVAEFSCQIFDKQASMVLKC
ncbi:hypothetical protein D3C86_1009110 [compost metagenome]